MGVETASALPDRAAFSGYVRTSMDHAAWSILRRKRTYLAAAVVLAPVILPIAIYFVPESVIEDELSGDNSFIFLIELFYLRTMTPLLALFFATMLISEEIESQTIPYILTRPIPRAAWVVGRFLAYLVVAPAIIGASMTAVYFACGLLEGYDWAGNAQRLVQYSAIAFMAAMAYGATCMLFGAYFRRPIITGLIFVFGWQRLSMIAPGLIDFFTVDKYVRMLMPTVGTLDSPVSAETELLREFKNEIVIGRLESALALALWTAAAVGLTAYAVLAREHTRATAVGD